MISFFAKSALVYGLIDAFSKSLSIFAVLIMTNLFTPAQIGSLELMLSLAALVGMVANCGLNNASQRFYWEKPDAKHRSAIVTSGFIAMVIASTLTYLCAITFYKIFGKYLTSFDLDMTFYLFSCIVAYGVMLQIFGYLQDVARLRFSPKHFFYIALSSKFISVSAALIAMIIFKLGIQSFITLQVLILVLVLPLCFSIVRHDFDLQSIEIKVIKRMINFGFPFIFASFSYWLLGATDRWMLSLFKDMDDVAKYSIAFRMGLILTIVTTGIGLAWSPVAMKIRQDYPAHFKYIYGDVLCLIVLVMYFVVYTISIFSNEIFSIMFIDFYHDSSVPFIILSVGIIFMASTQVTALGLGIAERTWYIAIVAVSAGVLNACLNYLLIPIFNINGAAYASTTSYLFMTVAYHFWSQRYSSILLDKNLFISVLIFCSSMGYATIILIGIYNNTLPIEMKISMIIFVAIISIFLISKMDIYKEREKFKNLNEIN